MSRKGYKTLFGLLVVILLFVFAFWAGHYIQDHPAIHDLIASLGYPSIIILAFIAGLNLVVPIPAVAFVPVFTASGFTLPEIITGLVVGTTFADLLAFYFGTLGKTYVHNSKQRVVRFFVDCCSRRRSLAAFIVFGYAAAVPLPNELLLVPLGALGYKLRTLFVPFVLGTIVHMTVLAYGIEAVFEFIY